MEKLDAIRLIFARSILVSRKWEVLINRLSTDDLTLKQLMFLIVASNSFTEPPTIKQLALELSTSHQNVKAIALLLEKKGFISLQKDKKDKRVSRVILNDDKKEYWEERTKRDIELLYTLFDGISDEELRTVATVMNRLDEKVSDLLIES